MFFIGGGKKGLPWGMLRTHREIANAKSDSAISQFCDRLRGTEYAPIAVALNKYLALTRNRSRPFIAEQDYPVLLSYFEEVMKEQGFGNERDYDWLRLPTVPEPTVLPVAPLGNTAVAPKPIVDNTTKKAVDGNNMIYHSPAPAPAPQQQQRPTSHMMA